eukprot:TRINITY_DN18074_c0_g1_i1.p1 TRINITY_DN18074_c0_g1~~TRINITY_DN18074_c0_g1_i1.p1  ORF type:complete len:436 (-),score=131.85 TRINITY_DN18074_c0_g1_i1:749-1990(-)
MESVLVINCGSSSMIFKVFEVSDDAATTPRLLAKGKANRIGPSGKVAQSFIECDGAVPAIPKTRLDVELPDHRTAISHCLKWLQSSGFEFTVVGHRFVHGGDMARDPLIVTPEVLAKLKTCVPLAPLHNPISLSVVEECQRVLPKTVTHYVVFDNAFHASLPDVTARYALPAAFEKYGYRKYGFHGLSYNNVIKSVSAYLKKPIADLKIIACHLGTGGSSVAAIKGGKSMDTTMGFTPLPGLIMGTRCGDIDPAIPLDLVSEHGLTPAEVTDQLNYKAGLLGISHYSSDLRDIYKAAHGPSSEHKEGCKLAWEMYVTRLVEAIGSFFALLRGVDVILFTDGIGIEMPELRSATCDYLQALGVHLDERKNHAATKDAITDITAACAGSVVRVLVVPNDEEVEIACGWTAARAAH